MADRDLQQHHLGEAFVELYPETTGVAVDYDDAAESITVTVHLATNQAMRFTHQCGSDDDSYEFVGHGAIINLPLETEPYEAHSYSGGDEY